MNIYINEPDFARSSIIMSLLSSSVTRTGNPDAPRVMLDLSADALPQLEALDPLQRYKTIVLTSNPGRAYREVLYSSYQVFAAVHLGVSVAHLQGTLSDAINGDRKPPETKFSRSEVAVLRHLMQGWTGKEIASKMGSTAKTVTNQISALMNKTGSPDRASLIAHVLTGQA